ncbi:phospholipase A2-like protein [Lentzea atacamensis]|uniref:Phospholipase A2-like protein n=1 Tax=Lentzea atacamensis TaxID=531938 RepID=A0ABX9E0U3_9PSEU|nr:phospholipase [Lentzea atacamensis]RAS61690.1 phospholipase A2-like protein [Lentzea atacamensis]
MSKTLRSAFVGATASLALIFTGAPAHAVDIVAVTDNYLYSKTLSQFTTLRAQQPHAGQLDWSSDGCSYSPDNPFGFKFLPTCHRHDFGYRNYKRQGRFSEANRLRIDNNFKSDMYKQCGSNWTCRRTADLYYAAVREFGGSASSTATSIQQAGLK